MKWVRVRLSMLIFVNQLPFVWSGFCHFKPVLRQWILWTKVELVAFLLDVGMSPDCVLVDFGIQQLTVLQFAAKNIRKVKYPKRLKQLVKLLLAKGANVDLRLDEQTPACIHFAAVNG